MTAERYGHPFPWRFMDFDRDGHCPTCERFVDEHVMQHWTHSFNRFVRSLSSREVAARRAAKAKRDADEPR